MNDFYALLNAFINTLEATTTETKNHKNIIINNVNQIYNKYLDTYKKNDDSEMVKDEEKEGVTINSLKELIMEIKNQNQLIKKRLRQKKNA